MASGDTLVVFHPYNNEPPSSNQATIDLRNQHPVLDFAADATERAVFSYIMPQHYDGGGVTVYAHFTMTSDTNTGHGVRIDGAFEDDGSQDIDADGFASAQSVTAAPNGTSGIETVAQISFTDGAQMDGVGAGDRFRFYIERDHDHADDDATGDMELGQVEIREA